MTRSIQCIIELNGEEAVVFLEDILNPKPNPARDATIERAKKLNIELR
ncbi:MAG: hypothetical protein Q7S22_08940 [Candidatus Micrarchaeota archaeon]|nr:hypothetical protein [Candidatus Micrarchaeota archaeon]